MTGDADPLRQALEGDTVVWLPQSADYDVAKINEQFAVVLIGSRAVVLKETPNGSPAERYQFLSRDALLTWLGNRFVIGEDGRPWTWGRRWLADKERRQYEGLEFEPAGDGRAGWYNLWRGFEVEPAPGDWSLLNHHILENVCHGDDALHVWVLSWFAHMFQKPRERIATSLVLRGKQGSGKTIIGQHFGRLIAAHYFLVDDPRYIVGQFNAHMASCLLLQADEGFWAGDKTAEGRLKGLVSSDWQMVEAKGIDPIRLRNYVRLLVTSNDDWVVPSGKDERRFAVFDVGDGRAKDAEYFGAMQAQLDAGGYAGLLHDMLAWDLDGVDLRRIPRTGALLEQKLRSLDPIEAWWLDRLTAGEILEGCEWQSLVAVKALYRDYCRHAEHVGVRRRSEETGFAIKFRKILPGARRVRRTITGDGDDQAPRRAWCYELPTLAQARETFAEMVEQSIDWGPE